MNRNSPNVDTRLRKVEEGHAEALIVAKAGLDRLELSARATEVLRPSEMLPAPGQGALGCQVRSDDAELVALLAQFDDPVARAETTAERAFLHRFGSGCSTPVAALGRADGDRLELEGLVINFTGSESVRQTIAGPSSDAEALGATLAERCLAAGADALIEVRQ